MSYYGSVFIVHKLHCHLWEETSPAQVLVHVHVYACMYVRVCMIGMKPKNVYIKMFTMELENF